MHVLFRIQTAPKSSTPSYAYSRAAFYQPQPKTFKDQRANPFAELQPRRLRHEVARIVDVDALDETQDTQQRTVSHTTEALAVSLSTQLGKFG